MTLNAGTTRTARLQPAARPADSLAQADLCAVCPKLCSTSCPVQSATGREAVSPWRISATVRDARSNGWTPASLRVAASCTGCGGCSHACLAGVTLPDESRAARADAARSGVELAAAQRVRAQMQQGGRPRARDAMSQATGDPTSTTAVLFGCTVQSRQPEIGAAAIRLAEAADSRVRVLPAPEPCCGAAALDVGLVEEARALASECAASLDGAERVVALSPGCARMVRDEWSPLGVESAVHVLTAPEWLAELVTGGTLPTPPAPAGDVAWHDPCTLARGLGVVAAPRAVLAALGARVVEPMSTGLTTRCSGAGAAYPMIDADGAAAVSAARRAELASLGAPPVTACPAAAAALGAEDLLVLAARVLLGDG